MSAAALGHALQISSGTYHADALWWVAVAFILCIGGTLLHRVSGPWSHRGLLVTITLLALGIGWNLEQHVNAVPGVYLGEHPVLWPFYAMCGTQAVLVVMGLSGWAPARRFWFPVVLLVSLAAGVSLLAV